MQTRFQTPDPDEPGKDPKEPWRPTDPEPEPIVDPPADPGDPGPYPVTDPAPPEPIPGRPPDADYRMRPSTEYSDDSGERYGGDDEPQYQPLKQRPVAEFFYRLM